MSNATAEEHDHRRYGACIGLTVKTPAGFSSAFAANEHQRAGRLVERAVGFFVAAEQLEPGEFTLALIRDGGSISVGSSDRLDQYDVVEGETLHLVSCRPHVDGAS